MYGGVDGPAAVGATLPCVLAGGGSWWQGEASPVRRGWANVLACRTPEQAAAKPREDST